MIRTINKGGISHEKTNSRRGFGSLHDFFHAAPPALAEHLYNVFLSAIAIDGISTVSGIFGADMQMDTVCDGPVTIILDTADIKKGK